MRVERIGAATLYLGDCREILPELAAIGALVTDPPYGIQFNYGGYDDTRENLIGLIETAIVPAIALAQRACITPGQTQVSLYPAADWISAVVWNTTGSFGFCGYTQWMPVLFYGQDVQGFGRTIGGVLKADVIRFSGGGGVGFQREADQHPCPKPENVMRAIVARYTEPGEVVLDPFMGSGTTGVACARLRRPFIGIEVDPGYFAAACRRIEQAQRQGDLLLDAAR